MDIYLTIRILDHDLYRMLLDEAKRCKVTPDEIVWRALDIALHLQPSKPY